jgi:drug/metabolite transporter (DMT)-like permease
MPNRKQNPVLIFLAFLAIYIIWGTTYLAILFGLEGFPPFLLSTIRFTVAGVLLLGWCLFKKQRLPSGKTLKVAIISGVIMLVGGSGLVTWAEQYVTSGQAAIVIATEPFLFILLDKKRWPLYFSQKSIIPGLLLGFSGVALFFLFAKSSHELQVSTSLKLTGYGVLFISGVLWVSGSLYSKTKRDETISNTVITSVQLIAAGVFSGLLSGLTGEVTSFSFVDVNTRAWGGLGYLIFMGSIVAYLAFTWLLTVRPPAQVSTHTYVNPVVAILMGWWIANEPLASMQLVGLGIILLGVLLTNKKASPA